MAMKDMYETERLNLHISNPKMVKEVIDYLSRNKVFLSNIEPIRSEHYYTEEYQKKILIDEYLQVWNNASVKYWLTKKGEERIIGTIIFNGIIKGSFQSCYLSYRLDKDELQKGYMQEAIEKGIEIAFKDMGLHRIEANLMPDNKWSIDMLSKLGFENEGFSKKYLKIQGKWEDHIHMVLLNEED